MPSARAAAIAGAMMSRSSRPNRPPSPACGLSPATPICGARPSTAPSAPCVMRSVSSTPSKVTASIASRSDMWMLTSTVRSSSLASIMRTGTSRQRPAQMGRGLGLQQFGVAREREAGGRERLLVHGRRDDRGDVRRAAPRARPTPRNRRRCGPATALIWPERRPPSAARPPAARGMQRGGTHRSASRGASISATGRASAPPAAASACAARRIVATSPATKQPSQSVRRRRERPWR